MDSDAARTWTVERLAQDAARVAIEGLGSSTFETLYQVFDTNLRLGAPSHEAQVRAAGCIFIEATRKDSPGNDPRVSGISLIWLARNYAECLPLTASELVNQMLPAYYDYRGQADRRKPHRSYLVYDPVNRAFQITIRCVLYHGDEQTQVMIHGRDESALTSVEQEARVDRYRFLAQPGDRIQFTLQTVGAPRHQEAWYTVTTNGPAEEASRSSLWLVCLRQQEVPPRLTRKGTA